MTTDIAWGIAACLDRDIDTWFPEGRTAKANADRAEAKATCLRCPIREDCLVTALIEEKGLGLSGRHGIRGGLSARQRFERETRTGAPPKPRRAA
ncbi:WhiB family transcriptional regulator [Streptomyces bacillaris]|uniref:WhiB family transcriptional regulator n=1 Tax=Streptomyces bacillaris TaxID=68179 RepID=UPI00364DB150